MANLDDDDWANLRKRLYVRARVKHPLRHQEAEDAVAETVLGLLKHRVGNLPSIEDVKRLAYTILDRRAVDALRQRSRRREQTSTDLEGASGEYELEPAEPDDLTLRNVLDREERTKLERAVANILDPSHPHYRGNHDLAAYDLALFKMHFEDGVSLRECGRVLRSHFECSREHDETFACRRMAWIIFRLTRELGAKDS